MSWWAIATLALGTYAMKAVGPVVLGSRTPSPALTRLFSLTASTLLVAVVALATFAPTDELGVDGPLIAGVTAAAAATARRAPFAIVVLVAAGVTAALRAIS